MHRRNLELSRVLNVSWGWVGLGRTPRGMARCTLPLPTEAEARASLGVSPTEAAGDDLLDRAASLLLSYFAGNPVTFDVPLDLNGYPPFTTSVLQACAAVPYGETTSYGDLAIASGHRGAARAVGQVMARNPLPIIIPCHRVVGSRQGLVGFGGGKPLKAALLALERGGCAGQKS